MYIITLHQRNLLLEYLLVHVLLQTQNIYTLYSTRNARCEHRYFRGSQGSQAVNTCEINTLLDINRSERSINNRRLRYSARSETKTSRLRRSNTRIAIKPALHVGVPTPRGIRSVEDGRAVKLRRQVRLSA